MVGSTVMSANRSTPSSGRLRRLAGPAGPALPAPEPPPHRRAQAQQVRRRLRQVDIDLVEPLDGRQRAGLAGLHQRSGREQRAADAAGNRRADAGEAEIDLGGVERAARRDYRGFGLGRRAPRRCRRPAWLTPSPGEELAEAVGLQLGGADIGLGLGELALAVQHRRAIGRSSIS